MSWRTNRRTKNKFPIEDRWGNKLPDQEPEPVEEELPSESVEVFNCSACHKQFSGQAYMVENEIICSECNRIDSKLEMAERARKQAQQPANPVPYVSDSPYASGSGNFNRRGDSRVCSKCGMSYAWGEAESHYATYHPGA